MLFRTLIDACVIVPTFAECDKKFVIDLFHQINFDFFLAFFNGSFFWKSPESYCCPELKFKTIFHPLPFLLNLVIFKKQQR